MKATELKSVYASMPRYVAEFKTIRGYRSRGFLMPAGQTVYSSTYEDDTYHADTPNGSLVTIGASALCFVRYVKLS